MKIWWKTPQNGFKLRDLTISPSQKCFTSTPLDRSHDSKIDQVADGLGWYPERNIHNTLQSFISESI